LRCLSPSRAATPPVARRAAALNRIGLRSRAAPDRLVRYHPRRETPRKRRRTVPQARELEVLRKTVLAKELTEPESEALSRLIKLRTLQDGEIVCDEGQADSKLHIVVSGALNVSKREAGGNAWTTLYALTAGDLVGELSFVDETPHYAALRAAGPTEILSLDRKDLEGLLDTQPRIVYRVMRAIMRTVHSLMRRMSVQAIELQNYIYKQHGRY
jgi:CRP-like cAMP-binding protein